MQVESLSYVVSVEQRAARIMALMSNVQNHYRVRGNAVDCSGGTALAVVIEMGVKGGKKYIIENYGSDWMTRAVLALEEVHTAKAELSVDKKAEAFHNAGAMKRSFDQAVGEIQIEKSKFPCKDGEEPPDGNQLKRMRKIGKDRDEDEIDQYTLMQRRSIKEGVPVGPKNKDKGHDDAAVGKTNKKESKKDRDDSDGEQVTVTDKVDKAAKKPKKVRLPSSVDKSQVK